MRLNYYWTDCADGSHVAVNYTVHEDRVSGSLRHWSPDASVNEGKKFEIPAQEISRDEKGRPFLVFPGFCAGEIRFSLDASAISEAGMN